MKKMLLCCLLLSTSNCYSFVIGDSFSNKTFRYVDYTVPVVVQMNEMCATLFNVQSAIHFYLANHQGLSTICEVTTEQDKKNLINNMLSTMVNENTFTNSSSHTLEVDSNIINSLSINYTGEIGFLTEPLENVKFKIQVDLLSCDDINGMKNLTWKIHKNISLPNTRVLNSNITSKVENKCMINLDNTLIHNLPLPS